MPARGETLIFYHTHASFIAYGNAYYKPRHAHFCAPPNNVRGWGSPDMTGSSMAAKLSSEQTELERKLERNRAAFEAWLERKKEEQRVKIPSKLYPL